MTDLALNIIEETVLLSEAGMRGPVGFDIQGDPSTWPGKLIQMVAGGNGRRAVTVAGGGADATLRTDLATATGSLMVTFKQTGSAALTRAVQDKLRERVSILDYGAVGNASTDCGPAIQDAHDALGPDGGCIYVPGCPSNYRWNTAVTFTKAVRFVGDGWYNSEFVSTTASLVLLTTTAWLSVEGVQFTALDAAAGSAIAIKVASTAANHGHSTLDRVYFDGFARCYWSQSTNALMVSNCIIGNFTVAGLYLENLVNSDTGDSFVTGCTISGQSAAFGAIVSSTSGINFTGNKFNRSSLGHVLISAGANLVGNFLFANNSFEGHSDSAIKLVATTGTITKTLITGNQFSSGPTFSNHIVVSNGAINTTITGNVFNGTNSGLSQAISLESGAAWVTITGNEFYQILSGISASSTANIGVAMHGNTFGVDVTNIWSGEFTDSAGFNAYPSDRAIDVATSVSNTSDTTYKNFLSFSGYGVAEITIFGLVQGAGACAYTRRVLIAGTGVTNIVAPVTSGVAFDVQLAVSSGKLVLGAKRASGSGTALTVYAIVKLAGAFGAVSRIP